MALPARIADQLYTVDEFETLPEFEERYELLDGRLVEKPMPGYPHGRITQRLNRAITLFDPDERLGEIAQEVNTKLSSKTAPLPDLSFWKADRKPPNSPGPAPRPDLVVEVLSPHDLASKKRLQQVYDKVRNYQASGVLIVWIINPRKQIIEIYHPDHAEAVRIVGITEQLDGGKVIPGFSLPVKDLFE